MILGVDVSDYQPRVDWPLLKAAGVEFVIIKATQGNYHKQRLYKQHLDGANKAGLVTGFYHWHDPLEPYESQAEWFIKHTKGLDFQIAACDVEQQWADWQEWSNGNITKFIAPQTISASARNILAYWDDRIPQKTVLYTRKSFIDGYAAPMKKWAGNYPLWLAEYPYGSGRVTVSWEDFKAKWLPTYNGPALPGGAKTWRFWQFTGDKFKLPGMYSRESGNELSPADVNFFNGTVEQLHAFAGVTLPAPEPEPEPEQPPEEENPPMGLYSNRARGVFLWEAHKASDFAALKGKIDFVVVYAGQGDMPAANFKENIKAARAVLGVPVLAYVSLLPDLYQGLDFNPAKFWTGKAEPHVKMLSNNLHYASGLSESIDGVVYDFSDYTMADGKTENNDNWAAALAEHVTNQLFAYFKKPVYPLCKPAFAAKFTNPGGAVANLFNSWGAISYVAANAVTVLEDGVRIPADTEGPRPPFISAWDFWWYGSQSFTGLAAAAALFLYKSTPAALYKELGFTAAPVDPDPEPEPEPDPEDPTTPPANADLAALMTELLKIGADVKVIRAFIEDMRKL